jgi:hypothetical protein
MTTNGRDGADHRFEVRRLTVPVPELDEKLARLLEALGAEVPAPLRNSLDSITVKPAAPDHGPLGSGEARRIAMELA